MHKVKLYVKQLYKKDKHNEALVKIRKKKERLCGLKKIVVVQDMKTR